MPTGKYWLGKHNIGLNDIISDEHITELRDYLSTYFTKNFPCNSFENMSMVAAFSRYNDFLKLYDMIVNYEYKLNKANKYLNFSKITELPIDIIEKIHETSI